MRHSALTPAALLLATRVAAQAPALPAIALQAQCTTEQATRDTACRSPLRLLTTTPPSPVVYPVALRAAGVEGFMVMGLEVAADGSVDSASVQVRSASNRTFVEGATTAIRQWRFALPAGRGEATPLRLALRISFEIGPYCEGARGVPGGMVTYEWYTLSLNPILRVITCRVMPIRKDQLRARPVAP